MSVGVRLSALRFLKLELVNIANYLYDVENSPSSAQNNARVQKHHLEIEVLVETLFFGIFLIRHYI
jgi:hypothetical protein